MDIENLLSALANESDFMAQIDAARDLGESHDPRAVVPLIEALQGDGPTLAAAKSLGMLGDERAVEPLLQTFENAQLDLPVRIQAAESLGQIGDPRPVDRLLLWLEDEQVHYHLRAAAARALGEIGGPRAVEPLTIAQGSVPGLRPAVIEALEKIRTSQASPPTLRASGMVDSASAAFSESSAQQDPTTFPDIEAADIDELKRIVYEDTDPARRMAALEKFISGTEPVEVLVLSEFVSKSGDSAVRERAIKRLVERGNQARAIFIIQGELDEQEPGEKWFGELTPEQRGWAAQSISALSG